MPASSIERRLRLFLFALAGALCAGTIVELWLQDHTQKPLQFLPFVLCGLGLLAVSAALVRPNRVTLWTLRGVMLVTGAGSLIGVYEHILSNLEVVRETQPALTGAGALWQALHGAAPLLAPGVLAIAASVALMATYAHPVLTKRAD